jgi:D-alanyl-D-alanine carboxypeptidase
VLRPVLLAFSVVLTFTSSVLAAPTSMATLARAYPAPPIRARAGVVMDASTGQVLASVNAHLHLPMASTTKVMTALIAVLHGKLTDRIKVPKAAFNFEADATVMGLKPGMVVTLKQLLYGLLLPSGADAANTIAIHYGRSEKKFVAMMNAEARKLGMNDTHYQNAHGLTSTNHYSSAYDLAQLGRYVSTIPTIMTVVKTQSYNWDGHVLTNLNSPLFWYPGVDGIKPGFTDDAGLCQLLDAQRHGRHVIVALLNTPDLDIDARNYLNFGLRDFTWTQSKITGDGPGLIQSGTGSGGPYDYFPASGHFVRGRFLPAFTAFGGDLVLGFPRTEPMPTGATRVQYFQNGALSLDVATGKVTRLALGLTPVPGVTPSPTPTATTPPIKTPTPAPTNTTVNLTPSPHGGTPTPPAHPRPSPTRTESAKATHTAPSRTTHTARVTPTPKAVPSPTVAAAFLTYWKKHQAQLGAPVAAPYHLRARTIQVFAYGALDWNASIHYLALLPIGDRLLAARGYLPKYPGNTYPAPFAGVNVLQKIGWLPATANART